VAARVSASQVKEIIDTTLNDGIILGNMIDTAHLYTNTHLSSAGHTDDILEKIELYLAAHFVAITEEGGALESQKMGDATDEWETSHLGSGLASTRYGQTAVMLDTTGILANVGAVKGTLKAEFRVV